LREKESIKKEWNDAAESWVKFVRGRKDYYRDELNNPATFKLIGDVRDRRALDLACGEGYNTRILARKGAKVTGVDFSQKLIDLAKREEDKEKLEICYCVADASDLKELSSNHFDLVACFMSLQDIEKLQKSNIRSRKGSERSRAIYSFNSSSMFRNGNCEWKESKRHKKIFWDNKISY
jgi:2-polyprenyl-3-methyl-5-hydroxy-6-metoxy-1,4-benzoquinol methylase